MAGKVSVVDPLLKLGDAQQSAGRAWRALHWAAGRGELSFLFLKWKLSSGLIDFHRPRPHQRVLGVESVEIRFEMVQMPDI